ncbi:MAG: YciC family protein [Candidatus Bathyarchaeota archaeon]|nr:YciC family protein [Candidatus Bathyarchaeota archaeon]
MKFASLKRVSVTEILDNSFSIYLSSVEVFFPIFLALNAVNIIITRFILGFLPPFSQLNFSADRFLSQIINYLAYLIPILSLAFLSTWVITNLGCGLAVKCALDVLEGRKMNVKINLLITFRSLKEILGISFLTGALIISGIILFMIPGIIVAVIFSLSIPALMHERLGVFGSLKRSKELTDGLWWKTFSLIMSVLALLIVAYLFVSLLAANINQSFVRIIIAIIVISLIEPIYPISISHLYYILIRRKTVYQPTSHEATYPQRVYDVEVRVCYSCGQVLPYDAIYCPNCGERVAY